MLQFTLFKRRYSKLNFIRISIIQSRAHTLTHTARARKSTLELEKLLKEFRKVSIEDAKKELEKTNGSLIF